MKINATYITGIYNTDHSDWEVDESELEKAFAKCLQELRKYKNYSLKQVEKGTEIPFQTIARYEKGENVPSILQAYKLSYFYKLPMDIMFQAGLIKDENREDLFREYGVIPEDFDEE